MTKERNKAFVSRFLDELDRDVTAVEEFFAPNCLAHLPGNSEPTNREGFKGFVTLFYAAFPDLTHKVEDQIAEDDKVVTRVTAHGSHQGHFQGIAPTGKEVMITDIMITRITEGKVVELWAQFDVLGLFQKPGVSL